MKRPRQTLVALALVAACGSEGSATPSTWMLGTWSNRAEGYSTSMCGVVHLKFEANGALFTGGVDCDAMPFYDHEYEWVHDGQDSIIVHLPDSHLDDAWRVSLGDTCDTIRVVRVVDGAALEDFPDLYSRGAVCLMNSGACPDGLECEAYKTVWCDDAPPPCEGASGP